MKKYFIFINKQSHSHTAVSMLPPFDHALPQAHNHAYMHVQAPNFTDLWDLDQRICLVEQCCGGSQPLVTQEQHVVVRELELLNLD
jgi:hypothetical protein